MMTRSPFLFSFGLCLLAASSHAESLWPEFRGPTAQGYSSAKGLPTEWAPDKNIVWRSEVAGKGWSSPVVANGKIFITTAVELPVDPNAVAAEPVAPPPVAAAPQADGSKRPAPAKKAPPPAPKPVSLHVIALDAATGKAVWDTKVFEAKDPAALKMHAKNSRRVRRWCMRRGGCTRTSPTTARPVWMRRGRLCGSSQENVLPAAARDGRQPGAGG
jgi:outer membrane protein assembly factor BamB